MKKIINILLFYNLIIICSFIAVGFIDKNIGDNTIFIFLFIPVGIYYGLLILRKTPIIKHKISKKRFEIIRKALAIYSFIFISILFAALVKNMTSLRELLFIILLLPLEIYFILQFINKFNLFKERKNVKVEENKIEPVEEAKTIELHEEVIKEKDKRDFIKLIAGAGLSAVIMVLINPGKAGAAFFGSVPGPGTIAIKDTTGTKIDPAIKSPTDGYGVANTDTASVPYYYGFVNKDGAWYIVKEVGDGSFLYAKGNSGYDFSNRASETYASFSTTF